MFSWVLHVGFVQMLSKHYSCLCCSCVHVVQAGTKGNGSLNLWKQRVFSIGLGSSAPATSPYECWKHGLVGILSLSHVVATGMIQCI